MAKKPRKNTSDLEDFEKNPVTLPNPKLGAPPIEDIKGPEVPSAPENTNPFFLQERVAAQIEPDNAKAAAMQGDIARRNQLLMQQNQSRQEALAQVERIRIGKAILAKPRVQDNRDVVPDQPLLEKGAIATGGVGGAVTGALGGAAIGSAIPVLGTAAGAVIGGVFGALGGSFAPIGLDSRQDVKAAFQIANKAEGNMVWIINELNSGQLDPYTARLMWDEELANFDSAEKNLKAEMQNDVKAFISNAAGRAGQVEATRRRIPQYQLSFETAILAPNKLTAPLSSPQLSETEQ